MDNNRVIFPTWFLTASCIEGIIKLILFVSMLCALWSVNESLVEISSIIKIICKQ